MTSSNPALVVPDASVLVGWFLSDEEYCPGSERLMADFEARRVALLAPPLLKHEIMNTLSLAVKRRRMAREAAVLAWNAFMDLGILFAEPDRFGRSVMALASLPGVSVYDATYVALAESYSCTCYTLDKKLVAAVRAHTNRVRLVSEYPAV
ncbi:MAG: type II toxin-antitoxin system VapC family toxin [Firmicutes bacterium]|nr:type II toxin-antitoxin system VapC family toxin [Candidatus Fermentithermobacillaceae bacterium]